MMDSSGGLHECDLVLDFLHSRFISGKKKKGYFFLSVDLYPATLLKIFIKSKTLMKCLGILTIASYHMQIEIIGLLPSLSVSPFFSMTYCLG